MKSLRGISTALAAERLSAGCVLCLAFCPCLLMAVCKAFSRERGSSHRRCIRALHAGYNSCKMISVLFGGVNVRPCRFRAAALGGTIALARHAPFITPLVT